MKKYIISLSLLIVLSISFFACKKDTTSLKARMFGKWTVNKIVVTGYTGTDALTKNGTFNCTTNDYIDFKGNDDDQFEQSLTNQRSIGTYTANIDDKFNLIFSDGSYYCTISTLSANQFQFSAALDKSGVVKVYYLSR
ncbi:lipocalin family protein [Pedobacter mucosus]|uniref:lipocalin family protein n=1 Tax=Pedobacter mucosus TaxID=2895286 RepID=UPI001EE47F81|nr:lipocalin family protein [Pedobacter mucosus]UKT64330.1 hypothetical protein LOK61_00815 [Pedobacter mucosus]